MNKIEKIRKKIDDIDLKLSKLLKKRAKLTLEIGKVKKFNSLPLKDKKREEEILEKFETTYEKEIFKKILKESKKYQAKNKL